MDFKNKTVIITGASRGIGHAIGLKLASLGANIAILSKTVESQAKLSGTIFSAAEDMIRAGGKALPLATDIRFEDQISRAIDKVVETFGGIDILINNASAINLSPTLSLDVKRFDLMNSVNVRGTFLCSQKCLPYLLKAEQPHVLTLCPPIRLEAEWLKSFIGYTISKYGMSLCVLGLAEEFRGRVAFNGLWPKTTIATAVVANILGGDSMINRSRKPSVVADAAYTIFQKDPKTFTGHLLLDEDILRDAGVVDFSAYRFNPELKESDLQMDFYV